MRSNPASLHEPSGFVNARFQPLRRLVRALKGEERLRGARAMRESTSCGGGSAIGVGARPASSIPQEAFQAAGRTGSGKTTWRRSAIVHSLSPGSGCRACTERVTWQQLGVAALAWVGPDMRGSPRAGFCGLAVPSRQPRAPALPSGTVHVNRSCGGTDTYLGTGRGCETPGVVDKRTTTYNHPDLRSRPCRGGRDGFGAARSRRGRPWLKERLGSRNVGG